MQSIRILLFLFLVSVKVQNAKLKSEQFIKMAIIKIFLLQFHYFIIMTTMFWNVGATRDAGNGRDNNNYIPVHLGVVLNLNSDMGAMADVCISMAIEDFYSAHSDYKTGLVLHTKDAQEDLDVVSEGQIKICSLFFFSPLQNPCLDLFFFF